MLNWIKKSIWKKGNDKSRSFILCEMCKTPIYFHVGSESWISWYRNKPCSAIFYLSWIILLIVSLCAIITMVIYAIVTRKFEILRFLGLPLGVFLCGGFLFYYCGKDFRDYETNIITIYEQPKKERKTSSSTANLQIENGYVE